MNFPPHEVTMHPSPPANSVSDKTRPHSVFRKVLLPMILICPKDGTILEANDAASLFYGHSTEELTQKTIFELSTTPRREIVEELNRSKALGGYKFYSQHYIEGGIVRDVEMYSGPLQHKGDDVICSIIHDATELKKIQMERDKFFQLSADMLCISDYQCHFLQVNEAWQDILGWNEKELLNRSWISFVHPDDRRKTLKIFSKVDSEKKELCNFENRFFTKAGEFRWLSWNTCTDFSKDRIYGIARDVTDKKRMEEDLFEMATKDSLTKAMTRRHFTDLATKEIVRAQRYGASLSCILADVDNFKNVNDTYGHHVGDRVLQFFASTLRSCLRDSDYLGRLGGEEFALLLPETDMAGAEVLAQRLVDSLAATPFITGESELKITASFGLAAVESGAQPAESKLSELLRCADVAMYKAKDTGKNKYCCYEEDDLTKADREAS